MAKEGNSDATVKLIIRYQSDVEKIAKKYKSSPLEEDHSYKEGEIGILGAIRTYDSEKGAQFKTYASRCVNNSIKSALKKQSRVKDIPTANLVALNEDIFENEFSLSAEDVYLAKESVKTLSDILRDELSRFEKDVLKLYVVGCSYSEIADRLGKNTKAVDNAIQRIRKKLSRVTF